MTDTHLELDEALAPLADVLDQVAEAAETIVLSVTPLDGSPGMRELAAEAPFRTPDTQTPLANVTTHAALLGYAAVDSTKAFAHHLRHPDLLVWAPSINARAGLDAAAFAFWHIERGIGVESRIQRGLTFELHNAREQKRAPKEITAAHKAGDAKARRVGAIADVHAWPVVGRKQRAKVGDQQLPFPRDAIAAVLAHRQGPDFETSADLEWWFYSGITHAAPYALSHFIELSQSRSTGVNGLSEAPVKVDGRQVVSAAASLGRAVLNLADAHGTLLGLDLTRVHRLDGEFARIIVDMLDAMDRGRQQPP